MKIKEKLKRNSTLRKLVKRRKIKKEYLTDFYDFSKYYNDSFKETLEGIEYKILLLVHSLEKGMCHKELRPFGEKKIADLIELLKQYVSLSHKNSSAFLMGISIINKWIIIYDENKFEKSDVYKCANTFIDEYYDIKNEVDTGKFLYRINDYEKQLSINYYDFVKSRHSVREFLDKPISQNDIEYCINSAILSPTACNRQMVKIYSVETKNKKELLDEIIMGLSGFEKSNIHYFVITFDICAFSFYGERNQGYFNAGLVAMNLVNAMHSRKIGSCFLQWGNTSIEEKNIKKSLDIPENEKIAVVIAAGYYKENSTIPLSHRKKMEENYKKI